jgi:hypothetical protein
LMTYRLSSENGSDNNVISPIAKSIKFMITNLLLIILAANDSSHIYYLSAASIFICSIK